MKEKILFACDLDNTLLVSHRIKSENDICAEVLEGKELSFFTPLSCKLIEEITADENVILLPVTTRSAEQYKRIKFPEGCTPELALVCNGSVLLKNGIPDENWYKTSQKLSNPYMDELKRLCTKYSEYDCFKTVRIVDDMFLFLHCHNRDETESIAVECKKDTDILLEYAGSKIYLFPPAANKGVGVRRFAENYKCKSIISAGDSPIDCSMLNIADIALVPDEKMLNAVKNANTLICKDDIFSEFILRHVIEQIK